MVSTHCADVKAQQRPDHVPSIGLDQSVGNPPLDTEHVGQQPLVAVHWPAVHHVLGRHDRPQPPAVSKVLER